MKLLIYYLDAYPDREILSRLNIGKFENSSDKLHNIQISRFFTETVKELNKIIRHSQILQSLIYPNESETKNKIIKIQKFLGKSIFQIVDINSNTLPKYYPNKREEREENPYELNTFVNILYLYIVHGLSPDQISNRFAAISAGQISTAISKILKKGMVAEIKKIREEKKKKI